MSLSIRTAPFSVSSGLELIAGHGDAPKRAAAPLEPRATQSLIKPAPFSVLVSGNPSVMFPLPRPYSTVLVALRLNFQTKVQAGKEASLNRSARASSKNRDIRLSPYPVMSGSHEGERLLASTVPDTRHEGSRRTEFAALSPRNTDHISSQRFRRCKQKLQSPDHEHSNYLS
jgi:hypothetical protein